MTRQSTLPALPAVPLESATPDGAQQRITLQRSVTLRAALGVFVLIATLAVYTCLAAHLGAWRAVPLTLAAWALLALCAAKHERARAVALKLGPDGLSAWDRAGNLLAQGRIAGSSQWTGRLLVLALAPAHGRAHTLLVAADALPAPVFRALAVLGRRGAGA
ncbi:MAG TPA: protein YgfX [Paraburkholderia sp.]|nr:protein YgfX [Paraburkholderia sp.]